MEEDPIVANADQNVSMESTATAEEDDEEELLDEEEPAAPVILRPEDEAMFAAEEYTTEIFSNMYTQEVS